MRPIKFLIPIVFILLVCFQNCGLTVSTNLAGISQSLGVTSGRTGGSLPGLNFPISWSTDTGNTKSQDVIYENFSILAENICALYAPQLQLENADCLNLVLAKIEFYNSVSSLKDKIGNLQELENFINDGLVIFESASAEKCLIDLDSDLVDLQKFIDSKSDESREMILAMKLQALWQILSSNGNCKGTLIDSPPVP